MGDYIVNQAGAKIYRDINKHQLLNIPVLQSDEEVGVVYEVLSVGSLGLNRDHIITVKKQDQVVAYRLPNDLSGWAEHVQLFSYQGKKVFPSKVEFGNLNNENYAHIY
ncbi:hypothetical protein [Oceanobacillus sp. J11TS1]|uniref:hypothetical protein n=1 Tax=Oceanobacillus sp. J11TS1 TaxID=2807191 RepID=UPI001B19C754|nr:hypothetical protein [Oceanobacillus sp. J11TS1]GIO25080.1 hypothetical protein J11TS1_36610 [Oceanobacillus sp. J11TS1]